MFKAYDIWRIKQRIAELEKARNHFPNSSEDDRRLREIDLLKTELENLDTA